jgi:hypothetical protein
MDKLHTGKTKTDEAEKKVKHVKATKHGRPFMRRRGWKEMSPVQRVRNVLMGAVQLVLVTLALWDISHRPDNEINGKKRTWVMASLIQPVGPIIYFMFGRKKAAAPAAA